MSEEAPVSSLVPLDAQRWGMTIGLDPDGSCPFPGLRPFDTPDSHFFFGRERHVDEMVKRLRNEAFVGVVGPSGAGKSSLVRAGLLPALYSGAMAGSGGNWAIGVLRPGTNPIAALASAVAELGDASGAPGVKGAPARLPMIEATLRHSSRGLVNAVRERGLRRDVLVVVDQFEELFRYRDLIRARPGFRDETVAFVALLLEAADDAKQARKEGRQPRVNVVLTMRTEYLGECAAFHGLPEALNRGQFLIPRLTRAEQQLAVEGPLGVAGQSVSPALVQRLLNDVMNAPDELPVLQHALHRTWERWERHHPTPDAPLELADYEAIGTLNGAIERHAEEVFGRLGAPEQGVAERVFRRLTRIDDSGRATRDPATFGELRHSTGLDARALEAVLSGFRATDCQFLLPPAGTPLTDDVAIDISHEAILRCWGRLRRWMDADLQALRRYSRLLEQRAAWAGAGEDERRDLLLRGAQLEQAVEWLAHASPDDPWVKREAADLAGVSEFVRASRQHAERARLIGNMLRATSVLGLLAVVGTSAWAMSGDLKNRQLRDLNKELSTSYQALEKQEREAQEKTRQLASANQETATLFAEQVELTRRLKSEKEAAARAANETTRAQNEKALTLEELKAANQKLDATLQAATRARDQLAQQLKAQLADIERLRGQLQAVGADQGKLGYELALKKDELNDLERERQRNQAEIARLRAELERQKRDAARQVEALRRRVRELGGDEAPEASP